MKNGLERIIRAICRRKEMPAEPVQVINGPRPKGEWFHVYDLETYRLVEKRQYAGERPFAALGSVSREYGDGYSVLYRRH